MVKMKKVITLLFCILINAVLFGQSFGDYKSNVTGSWNWSTTANWLMYDGGSWISASEFPGQNSNAGIVTISDNTQVIVDQTISNNISSLVISGSNFNTSLSFGGAFTLNVTGDVSFSVPISSSVINSLDVGTGKLSCSSLTMSTTADDTKVQNVSLSTGEIIVSQNIVLPTPNQNVLTISSTGALRVGNSFIPNGTISLNANSIVEFNGTSQNINAVASGYGKVILSGSGTKELQSALTVNGDIIVNTGVELFDGGFPITGVAGKQFNLLSGATYTTSQITTSSLFPKNVTITIDATSTVNLSGNGSYSLPPSPAIFGTITLNGTSTVTLSGSISVSGDVNINTGSTLVDAGFPIAGNVVAFRVASGATYTTSQTNSSIVFPALATSIILDNNSTVNFTGTGNYSLPILPSSYGAVTISGTSTVTVSSPITVNGNFTLNTGVVLNDGGNVITGNASKSFNVLSGATFTSQISTPSFPLNSIIALNNNSTVNFNASGDYILPSTTYGTITLNNTGTVTITATLLSAITVNGNLNVNAYVELFDNNFAIIGTAGKQCNVGSNAIYTTARTTTSWFPTLMTTNLDPNSTVNINGNASYTIANVPSNFGNLNLNGTGTHTLSFPITIKGNLAINAGTLADGGKQITGNATGTLTMLNGTGLTLGSTTVATTFPTTFLSGNISISTPPTVVTTVTYSSALPQIISSVPVYSNLTISTTATSTIVKTIDGNITINRHLTVNGYNELNDNGYTVSVKGNVAINTNGIHTGTGKILLNGISNQTISGVGSMNNLEIANTGFITNIANDFIVNGNVKLSSGSFTLGGRKLTTGGNITIESGTVFTVNSNATLLVSSDKLITNNSGKFSVTGLSASNPAKVTINGSTGQFTYTQNGTADLSANYYQFDNCELILTGASTVTGNLSYGTFSTIGTSSNATYINFDNFTQSLGPTLVTFNEGPDYNIRNAGSSVITFSSSSGTYTGAANQDPATILTNVIWNSSKKYYSQGSGDFNNLALWNDKSDGTGNPLPLVSYLTNKTCSFVIKSGHTITENATLDIYHLSIVSGGILKMGKGAAVTMTIQENFVDSGSVIINNINGIHTINFIGNVKIDGNFNLFNNTSQVANVNFNCSSTQILDGTPSSAVTFNNVTLGGMTVLTPSYPLTILGNVTFGANTTFNADNYTHTVAGNWTGSTTGSLISSGTILFNGTTAQVISGLTNFNNITISGSGGTTFGGATSTSTIVGNLSVINSILTIGNSTGVKTINVLGDVQIDAGSSVLVGAANATHILNLSGNVIVNGLLNLFKNSGQVCNTVFKGTNNQIVSGSGTTCNFNVITVNKGTDASAIVEITRTITQQAPTVSSNYLVISNGTFKLSSPSVLTPYFAGQTICSATGRLWINNTGAEIACVGSCTLPSYAITTSPGVPTVNGILQVTAGTFEYGSGDDRMNLTVATSALIIDGSNAMVRLFGGLNNAGLGAVTISAGNLIVDCQRADVGGNNVTTATHIVDLRGYINFTGGKLTIVDPSANTNPDLNATLLLWTLGTKSPNFAGSTIQFGDGISTSAGGSTDGFDFRTDNTGTYYLGNIIVNNPASTTNRHLLLKAGNAYIGGKITVSTNSSILFNGNKIYLKGDFENNGTLNTSVANSTLYLNGLIAKQILSGASTSITNLVVDNTSGVNPSVEIQNTLTIQTSYLLTNGSLNTNGGSLTFGTGTSSTFTITRTDGTLLAIPIWNLTGVTCRVNYNKSTTSITTGNELPNTSSGVISTLTVNNVGNSVSLNTGSNITVGNVVLTNGILHLQNESIILNGTIARTLGSISSGTGASISFNNTASWTIPANTFTGNIIELSNITIKEGASGTITNYVVLPANLTVIINGSLSLNHGRLVLGTNNTLGFQTSNSPIIRDGVSTLGSLQVYSTSSLVFGVTNSTGNAVVIPNGTFYGNPSIANLTINRTNGVTFGNQPFSLNGKLTLTSGVLNNNGLVLSTSNTSTTPFVTSGGTLVVGSTIGTTTTGTLSFTGGALNTTTAIIPDNFFATPATFAGLSVNRAGGILLANQDITIKGTTTLTNGKITLADHDLEVTLIGGTPSASSMIIMPSTGNVKRYYKTGATNFTFPIGDNSGTYCPATINLSSNSTASYIVVKSYNVKHPSIPVATTDYINRYWTISAPSLSTYTYSAAFTYSATDIVGTSEADFLAQRYNSTTWNQVDLSTANTTTHTLSTGPVALTQITGTLHNNSFTAYPSNSILYYWSKNSGAWNTISATTPVWVTTTVNTDPGVAGTAALVTPTSANSKGITIRSGNNISMNSGYTIDQITIKNTGTLTVNTASFTVNNGAGTDFAVDAGAKVIATSGSIIGTSGSVFQIDGIFTTSNANGFSGLASSSIRSLNSPIITLGNGSTIEYNGVAQTVTNSTEYGNLLLSTAGKKSLVGNATVNGNVTINTTGDSLCIGGAVQKTLIIKGNLLGTGQINMNGAKHILELDGSTNSISLLLTDANKSTIMYNAAGNQTVFASPNYKNVTIAGIGTKTLQGISTIANDLTIQNLAIFEDNGYLCSIKGNLSNFGIHSSIVPGAGKLSLIGTATQTIDCSSGSGIFGNVDLNNASVPGHISLTGSNFTFGSLSITSGTLFFGASPIVVNVLGDLNGSGGKINMSFAAHDLKLSGQMNTLATLITDVNQSTVTFNRIGNQSLFNSLNYRNVSIEEAGVKQLQGTTVINNDLTILNATTVLDDNGKDCYVKGNIINNGSHTSSILGSGKLSLTGGSTLQTITCSNFNPVSFGNLVINAIQNSSISGSDITINGNFIDSIKTLSFTTISSSFTVKGNSIILGTVSYTSTSGTKTFNDVSISSTGKWISLVSEDFEIGGDFKNLGTFIPGAGIYTFGGALDQIIKTPTAFNISLKKTGGKVTSVTASTPLLIDNLTLETGNLGSFEASDNTTISGDITLNGGLVKWGNDVVLNGTVDQIIDGTGTIPSFKNLTINNSFTSTDAIVLNKPILIDGVLTLTNGIVKTDAINSITMGDIASISGTPTDATFIDGPLTYTISSMTEVTKVYPIGKNNVLHQIELTVDQSSSSPTNTYTCEFINGNANGLYAFPATASSKAHVSSFGYWHVSKSNEILDTDGNDPQLDKASVKLYYLSNEGITDPTKLYIAKSNGKTNLWMNIPQLVSDASSITSTTFNGFCDISLGSDCDCNALPISLTDFTIKKKTKDVLVSWETASETNNELFTLERSNDGKNWKSIYVCQGAGTTTEKSIYSFVDTDDNDGLVYYRLKQTDLDGTYSYSSIRSIRMINEDLNFTVYPNPSTSENVSVLIFGNNTSDIILKVIDNIGREIYTGTIELTNSKTTLNLSDVCTLNTGVFYTIVVISKDRTVSRKISVQ